MVSRLTTAAVMILLALLVAKGIPYNLARWEQISGGFRTANVLLTAACAALAAGALVVLFKRGWRKAALVTGGGGAVLVALTVGIGVLSGIIPCSGPS